LFFFVFVTNAIQMSRSKYKDKYDDKEMEAALKAVREEGMRPWTVSKRFGVPRTTLLDRVAGRTPDKAAMGAPPVLNAEEEATLCDFIAR
jgi:transposase